MLVVIGLENVVSKLNSNVRGKRRHARQTTGINLLIKYSLNMNAAQTEGVRMCMNV